MSKSKAGRKRALEIVKQNAVLSGASPRVRISISLPTETYYDLKVRCLEQKTSVQAMVSEWIKGGLYPR